MNAKNIKMAVGFLKVGKEWKRFEMEEQAAIRGLIREGWLKFTRVTDVGGYEKTFIDGTEKLANTGEWK